MPAPDPADRIPDGHVQGTPRIALTILGTSDLHMHLGPHDDLRDAPQPGIGLSTLATLVSRIRASAPNCLLFDNGDSLEGSPVADYLVAPDDSAPHPLMRAMNAMGYDASTLGNHDFNFGIDYLARTLSEAKFPVVVSNARFDDPLPIRRHLLLDREFRDETGALHQLRVGVIGVLPPQTPQWESRITGRVHVQDILGAALDETRILRDLGADLVIALSHSGIDSAPYRPGMENAAAALAAMSGIDAVIAGHSHLLFPSDQFPAGNGIDPEAGQVSGTPLAMPGFWGSHLARIELDLQYGPAGWQAIGGRGEVLPGAGTAPDPKIEAIFDCAHRATRRRMQRQVGRSQRALYSHFALLGHDPASALVARAKAGAARTLLADGPWADVPVLCAAAPLRAGGRNGAQQFTDLPAGAVTEGGLFDLYPFTNDLAIVPVTGADLRDWIERSASLFHRITPDLPDQSLRRPDFPAYNHDAIHGLTYRIDLAQAPLYDTDGRLRDPMAGPDAGRLRDLRHDGRPVAAEDRFMLVTNRFRLAGCGLFGPLAGRLTPLEIPRRRVRDILRDFVAGGGAEAAAASPVWAFLPMDGASVIHETGPGALAHLPEFPGQAEPVGEDAEGFLRLRVRL